MSSPVPWSLAVRVAGNIAGTHPLFDTYHAEVLAEEAPRLVARAEALVEAETGLSSHGTPSVVVLDREQWIERNVDFFTKVIEPAHEAAAAGGEPSAISQAVGGRAVALEAGALLGVMARKVLGQYELVLPSEAGDKDTPDDRGDAVYLVGPNVLALERAHQLRPSEFRFWLALHECTHRLQFVGIPWMRDYFFGLITELVAGAGPEPGRFKRLLEEARTAGESGLGDSGLLGMLATPEQRATIDRVQALMSLLEGHGHVVMDRIGERTLVSAHRMSNLLKQRRKDPKMAAFFRLTGLEMKMKQYEMGERFILSVERQAGWDALAAAWQSPDHLPTLAEIGEPSTWLQRVA